MRERDTLKQHWYPRCGLQYQMYTGMIIHSTSRYTLLAVTCPTEKLHYKTPSAHLESHTNSVSEVVYTRNLYTLQCERQGTLRHGCYKNGNFS